ncbi:MAG: PgaD family protein [Desulfobacteraceae bacterium]
MELLKLLTSGGLITLIIVFLLVGWTYYNLLFIKWTGERRNSCVAITRNNEVARLLQIELSQLERLKSHQVLRVRLEKEQQYKISLQ